MAHSVTFDAALASVIRLAKASSHSRRNEVVPLCDSVGRVASESLQASKPRPAFNVSAMDGYAVNSASTALASVEHPVVLLILGHITAGFAPPAINIEESLMTSSAFCYGINTGARFPTESRSGTSPPNLFFDAVIPLERVKLIGPQESEEIQAIKIISPISPCANLRRVGEDYPALHPLVVCGTRIEPKHVLLLASANIRNVKVFQKPRIGIITTGEEIKPGEDRKGSIPDCSSPYLVAALQSWGYEAQVLGSVGESQESYAGILNSSATEYDVLVSTGAVSASKSDFVPTALSALGATLLFHRVGMRPGHPVLLATLPPTASKAQETPIFALPGNPIATIVSARFLVAPFLRVLTGRPLETPRWGVVRSLVTTNGVMAQTGEDLVSLSAGKMVYAEDGRLEVEVGIRNAAMVNPVAESDCWIMTRSGASLKIGKVVELWPQDPA